jgi:hypothetical protein
MQAQDASDKLFLRLPESHQISVLDEARISGRRSADPVPLIFLIPETLAFASGTAAQIRALKLKNANKNVRFISSELHKKYVPFAADFGPVNLGTVHRFCQAIDKGLAKSKDNLLIYCIEPTVPNRANACFLLACFMVIYHGWTVERASATFQSQSLPFSLEPFRDATFSKQDFGLSIRDCLCGLTSAMAIGWYNQSTFDLASYELLDDPLFGDLHQICPKFVAFKGPLSCVSAYRLRREIAFAPSEYVPLLQELGVTCVVRLNEPDTYDRSTPPHLPARASRHRRPGRPHTALMASATGLTRGGRVAGASSSPWAFGTATSTSTTAPPPPTPRSVPTAPCGRRHGV